MNISNFSERVEWFNQPGIGEVVQLITPDRRGRVKFKASFWPARLHPNFEANMTPHEEVAIVGREGITLLVAPLFGVQIA